MHIQSLQLQGHYYKVTPLILRFWKESSSKFVQDLLINLPSFYISEYLTWFTPEFVQQDTFSNINTVKRC